MPSIPSSPPPSAISPPQRTNHHHIHLNHRILLPLIAGILTITVIGILVLVIFLYRKLSYNRTTPFDQTQQSSGTRRFSYSVLRRATGTFSTSNRLGHGGFGSVYKATLPAGQSLAVKVMDSQGSIQGEREFYNELSLASNLNHPHILALFGFATDRRGKKLILVYELMPNRSLQDALLDRKCIELMEWKRRFSITLDIAKGLEYLHCFCNPPVIHGDIKPSNVLLDSDFNAKIGDFGLARTKTEDPEQIGHVVLEVEEEMEEIEGNQKKKKKREESIEIGEENASIMEEMESASLSVSVMTGGFEDGCVGIDQSPESSIARALDSEASPENIVALSMSLETAGDKVSGFDGVFDKFSIDSKKNFIGNGKRRGGSGRDWWWKQDNGIGSESGRIKDYVMEWIGNEIKKERPKNEWVASPSSLEIDGGSGILNANTAQKKRRKKLEWWASLDEDKVRKKDKNRKPREWWKEEFCDELSKKKKKKRRGMDLSNGGELWWQKDGDEIQEKKKKRKSKTSRGSIDWWLDGLSGELRSCRRNSQDWTSCEIPKSGGISSTPSMRGTVCYVAPEYGGGGQLSEKCDVYSFGVLILVLISGRRPLQVMASPMSEFERANLISWARQLARNGKLLDLVDPSIHSLNKEEALLCLTIALLCLQRTPAKRPSMKEIVEMLSGESEPPHLPFEFSPSPPSNFPFKSRKKIR